MVKKQKVSLRNDITFKHFFKNNEKALISLLESFLPLAKGRRIQSVKILDSLLQNPGNKETIMDLRLILDNQRDCQCRDANVLSSVFQRKGVVLLGKELSFSAEVRGSV